MIWALLWGYHVGRYTGVLTICAAEICLFTLAGQGRACFPRLSRAVQYGHLKAHAGICFRGPSRVSHVLKYYLLVKLDLECSRSSHGRLATGLRSAVGIHTPFCVGCGICAWVNILRGLGERCLHPVVRLHFGVDFHPVVPPERAAIASDPGIFRGRVLRLGGHPTWSKTPS